MGFITVKVFVSSTCDDLEDCRQNVTDTITACQAVPIVMENWTANYRDNPIQVCRLKIEQSTHYIGIFAFRRGWVPPERPQSITEIEFGYADAQIGGKNMAVFLPKVDSKFGIELKRRAANQSESDAIAQETFRNEVKNGGYCVLFEDLIDLVRKVQERVSSWVTSVGGISGIRSIARQAESSEPLRTAASNEQPTEAEIIQLGHKSLSRQFEDSLEVLSSEQAAVVCFLIHGASGYGHKEMVVRLRQILEQQRSVQARRYKAAFSPLWREKSLAKLLELIGDQIEQGWIPDSPEVLAQRLHKMLETSDVILEITEIQRFNGSLLSFIKDFWHPTVSTLKKPTQHRLVVLLTLEQTILPEWEAFVQSPLAMDDDSEIDSMRPIKLAELKEFTEKELTSWLSKWRSPNDALVLAKTLMDETKGNPQLLYNKLRDDSTWVG